MNRQAFLLGLFSVGGQVLLLRELTASLNGDELFIGTALFGWLVSVALGAYLGGKYHLKIKPVHLFYIGVILLPVMVVIIRLSPLVMTDVVGEIVPFSNAALFSIVMMFPVGIISGWLFSSITRQGKKAESAVVLVYLLEGLGAFAGGLMITLLVGAVVSTLEMSVILGVLVICGYFITDRSEKKRGMALALPFGLILLVVTRLVIPYLDVSLEEIKYGSYEVEKSFDTHYGHQVFLSRNDMRIFITDNRVEAVYPERMTVENLLLPPLVYHEKPGKILFVGRAEFGLSQAVDVFPNLSVTSVDSRKVLNSTLDQHLPVVPTTNRLNNDPVAYFSQNGIEDKYDIIILNPGEPDSYKSSRLLSVEGLAGVKECLGAGGILSIVTPYDTDRYINPESKVLLSMIYNNVGDNFKEVTFWPGTTTILLASDAPLFDIPYDAVISRLNGLAYAPQFLNEDYLYDRLNEFKISRLKDAVGNTPLHSSLNKPLLPHYQSLYRAVPGSFDKKLFSMIFEQGNWLGLIPALIILFFITAVVSEKRKHTGGYFGLFLYFTAGLMSLSLELVSFYVYQSKAGSLYAEMAVLIGAFMLGLAIGTYLAVKLNKKAIGVYSLIVFLLVIFVFNSTCQIVPSGWQILYHLVFLFIMAMATGALFVAATGQYYRNRTQSNRGAGYAVEITGSSLGALLATTVFLPVIGLSWLLLSLGMLAGLVLIGFLVTVSLR